jgi:hypothetical protein
MLNRANSMIKVASRAFNKIEAIVCGKPHAFRIAMFDRKKITTPDSVRTWEPFPALKRALVVCCVLLAIGVPASAQALGGSLGRQALTPGHSGLNSSVAVINLSAVLPASVSLSVSSVPLIVSVKDPNNPTEIIRVPVTSSWHLGSSSNGVELVGYFESPQQALVDAAGHGIPSARVEGALSGQQLAPFTETSSVGTPGGSRTLYRQAISQNMFTGSRNDVIEIRVARISDLGLQSGTYGGTLRLRMVAY